MSAPKVPWEHLKLAVLNLPAICIRDKAQYLARGLAAKGLDLTYESCTSDAEMAAEVAHAEIQEWLCAEHKDRWVGCAKFYRLEARMVEHATAWGVKLEEILFFAYSWADALRASPCVNVVLHTSSDEGRPTVIPTNVWVVCSLEELFAQ